MIAPLPIAVLVLCAILILGQVLFLIIGSRERRR